MFTVTAEQLWCKVGRQTFEIELLQQQIATLQQRIKDLEGAQEAQLADDPEEGDWRDAAVATARLERANGLATVAVLPGNGDGRD